MLVVGTGFGASTASESLTARVLAPVHVIAQPYPLW
jgi:hypothetical protein